MLYDNLRDIIKHTHGLGFIEAVKIVGADNVTKLEAIAADKTVVMYGELTNPITELKDATIGFSRMPVLSGMLNFPLFSKDDASVTIATQDRNGTDIPCEVNFKSGTGHNSVYRFMSPEAVKESIQVPAFKGVTWDVVIEPTSANLKELSYFAGILGSYEPVFDVVVKNGNLDFHIGSGPSDKSIVPIARNVEGKLPTTLSWGLNQVLPILKLSESSICTMSFSSQGAAKIEIDSGLGKYQYILPARAK